MSKKALLDSLTQMARESQDTQAALQRAQQPNYPGGAANTDGAFGAPHIRSGEDPLSSRPFYIARAANVLTGQAAPDTAKFEIAESERLKRALAEVYGGDKYPRNSVVVPIDWNLLPDTVRLDKSFAPMRQAMHEAVAHVDPEFLETRRSVEVHDSRAAKTRMTDARYVQRTAMSYLDQQSGGALVAPPQFGDLIPILRNKAILPNIGAVFVPLPPQGAIKYPRQTGVTTIKEKPENTPADESNPTFDDVTLEPKQFIGLVRASNQLLAFAPGVAEMAIRNDLAEQIALTFDLAGLEGSGGPNRVNGIVTQASKASPAWTVNAKVTGANGDTWTPPDVSRTIRKNMQRNSDVKTFVMRPDMWLGITEARADAVAAGDKQGAYLWNMLRMFGEDFGETLRQRRVVTSNQVSNTRAKGNATNLTYILGLDGNEILVGMHGVLVLDANPWETTAYASNQTLLRAILFGDVGVRRGAGVALMDTISVPNLD